MKKNRANKNNVNRKRIIVLIACIAFMLLFYLQMNISKEITAALFVDIRTIAAMTFQESLFAIFAISLAALLGRSPKKIFSSSPFPKKRRLRKCFFLMMAMYSPMLIFMSVIFHDLDNKDLTLRPLNEILLYIAFVFLIGVAEETLFRGIIAESMKRAWGRDNLGIASLLSGLLFGLMHLCNLRVAEPTGVLVQVCGASAAGMLFSDLYYFSGSLWPCIIFHSLVDFGGLLGYGFFGIGSFGEILSSYSPIMCLMPAILIIARIVMIVKKRTGSEKEIKRMSSQYV